MRKMFMKMKKNFGYIALIFILLLVQAYCDLSLPEYTSKIVDTGIQQKGIEDAVPSTIRKDALASLLLLTSPEDSAVITDSFSEDGDIFRLNEISEADRTDLNKIMARAEMIRLVLSQSKVDMAAVPEAQLNAIIKEAESKIDAYPEAMITQGAVAFVQKEYEAQNIDVDAMQSSYIAQAGIKMLGMSAIALLCAISVAFISSRIAAELGKDLRNQVYRKVLGFSSNEMNKFSTASLITRSTNDIQQVQLVMTLMFRIILYAPILAVGGIIKVSTTGAYLRWILALGVGLLLTLISVLFASVMPRFKRLQTLIDRINRTAREILTGIPVIRAFTTEAHEQERFENANRDLTKTNLFVNRAMAMLMPTMFLIMNSISVLIVYSGAHGIDAGKLQVGDMMAFIQYAMQIIISFLMISAIAVFMPRASVSAKRISEVLETSPIISSPQNPSETDPSVKGSIEFKNVTFSYPGAEAPVLHDISFKAAQGETVAFIGSTGSGKSTIMNLIPRFYDATAGEILIDGKDVKTLDLKDLRSRIGFVPQKSVLFSGTISSNIRYGRGDASDEDVMHAASIAQASEFIGEKEDGINAHIAQGGSNVSGGQKQRLAIARAIARKPEFYIFDDSFSALDFKTDAALRKALRKEMSSATTLIVAQRISTVMGADKIIVLDEGRIVGTGSHDELMKSCSVYMQIAKSQLSQEELDI